MRCANLPHKCLGYFSLLKVAVLYYCGQNEAPKIDTMIKYVNRANERKVTAYPHPKYYQLFVAYCHDKLKKKASVLENMISEFFDEMSDQEKQRLMRLYDQMEEAEKRHTAKII